MKRILLTLLCAIALTAPAQVYHQLLTGGTNYVAADTVNTYSGLVVNTRNASLLSLQMKFKALDTSTDNVVATIDGSVDGASYVAGALGPLVVAADGTNTAVGITNLDVSAYLFIRVRYVTNASATVAVTNLAIAATTKVGVDPWSPISIANGGTAGATAAAARANLAVPAATSGSLTNVSLYGAKITGSFTNVGLTASLPVFTDANKVLVSKSAADTLAALGTGVSTNGNMSGMTLHGSTTNSALTASLPVFTDANKVLASVSIANTLLALGIQSGSATSAADGAVTNTFTTAFASAPVVVLTPTGETAPTLQYVVTNVSATAFITVGDAAGTYSWIAIGAP